MKKLLTIVLSLAMVFSMTAVSFADTYTDTSSVDLTKVYKLATANTENPAETFNFSIEKIGVTDSDETLESMPMFEKTDYAISYDKGEATVVGDANTTTLTLPEYDNVGVYTYKITEIPGNTAGVVYNDKALYLVVTVVEDPTNGRVRVAHLHYETATGSKTENIVNTYEAGSLTVGKTVTGLLGDKTKDFNMTVTFTVPANKVVKSDIYYADGTVAVAAGEGWTGTKTVRIALSHGETIGFTNIPYGITYDVVEESYSAEKYDNPTYDFDDEKKTIDSASENVQITNNKKGDIDTGIIMDNGIYILLLAGAAAGVGLFIARRRNSFES